MRAISLCLIGYAVVVLLTPRTASAHGDVTPQAVDTADLPSLGETWVSRNPYRGNELAIKIGKSAYNQQCARCHGLEAISGGFASDLRHFPKGDEGDEDFVGAVRKGVVRGDRALMPNYADVLSQEAVWAIRSWLESVHEE